VLARLHALGELDFTLARQKSDTADAPQVDAHGVGALRFAVVAAVAHELCRFGRRCLVRFRRDRGSGTGRLEWLDFDRERFVDRFAEQFACASSAHLVVLEKNFGCPLVGDFEFSFKHACSSGHALGRVRIDDRLRFGIDG
jgi:hypothetical protein